MRKDKERRNKEKPKEKTKKGKKKDTQDNVQEKEQEKEHERGEEEKEEREEEETIKGNKKGNEEEIEIEHPLIQHTWALYKGEDYLWGAGEHNLSGQGGWSPENEQFFEGLNQEVLSSTYAYKRYLIKSVEQSFVQLFNVEMQPQANVTADSIYRQSQRFRPTYGLLSYLARQRMQAYTQESISAKNLLQKSCLLLSIIILLGIHFLPPATIPTRQQYFSGFIISAILVNAIVVVAFWGNNAHYQSRVAWLLTLPAFYEAYSFLHRQFSEKKQEPEEYHSIS